MKLPDNISYKLNEIFKKYNTIQKVILFGSRANDSNTDGSDIDLAFFCTNKTKNIDIIYDIKEINTLYTFDVTFFDENLDTLLKSEILNKGVVIYGRKIR